MQISSDYVDLLSALNDEGAEYLVVGAYAVAYHARPRYTKDLDLWIRSDRENATRVHRALVRFGAPMEETSVADLTDPASILQIGVEPVRVDILTSLPGLSFEEAWAAGCVAHFGGQPVRVLGMDHLMIAKKRANRPQDRLDLRALEKVRRGT